MTATRSRASPSEKTAVSEASVARDRERSRSLLGTASPWPLRIVLTALLMIQLGALLALLRAADEHHLHSAPVELTAPGGLAAPLADDVNRVRGRPLAARPAESARAASLDVEHGRAIGALVVDLRGTEDELLVDGSYPLKVRSAMVAQARELEATRGRSVRVHTTNAPVSNKRVRVVALVVAGGGFLIGTLMPAGQPNASTRRPGRVGLGLAAVVVAGVAAAASLQGNAPTALMSVVAAAAAGCTAGALIVALALKWLAGRAGVLLGLAAQVVLAAALLRDLDPALLPAPSAELLRGTPTWATYDVLSALANHDGHGLVRPVGVLGTWLVVAGIGVTAAVSRRRTGTREPERAQVVQTVPGLEARWRHRAVALLGAALTAIVGLVLLAPEPGLVPVETPDLASQTRCVATGAVTDLRDLNRISAQVRGDPSFEGGDVGADVRLQDGRRLMLFGDTLRGPDFGGQQFVRNSMLVVGPDCIRSVVPASGGAIIPDRISYRGGAVGYWPMSVGRVARSGYDLVAVAAQRVRATGSGAFDFQNLGPAVAVFVVPRGGTPQLLTVRDLGADDDDPAKPEWGAATAVADGWLYVYGTARPNEPGVFGFSLRVARVRPDNILDTDRWTYWDGTRWQPDPSRAVALIGADGGVSQTLSVFEQGGTWYALSKRNEFLGTDVVAWRATSPHGPFDRGTTVANLPSDAARGQLRYMPLAHPDLLPEQGTMVVSYSRNRTDVGQVILDPFEYRPRFLRVPLPR
jgi:hypothetical protein